MFNNLAFGANNASVFTVGLETYERVVFVGVLLALVLLEFQQRTAQHGYVNII